MVEEIATKSLKCGKRLYHFNLKKTSGGNKYIDIVEIRNQRPVAKAMEHRASQSFVRGAGQQEDSREKDRIMIFEDHINEFMKILSEMAANLKKG